MDRVDEANDEPTNLHQAELEAEAAGLPFSSEQNGHAAKPLRGILKTSKTDEATKAQRQKQEELRRKAQRQRQAAEEELERQKGMMSKSKRKLYERMAHGNKKRDDEAATLRAKRRRLES